MTTLLAATIAILAAAATKPSGSTNVGSAARSVGVPAPLARKVSAYADRWNAAAIADTAGVCAFVGDSDALAAKLADLGNDGTLQDDPAAMKRLTGLVPGISFSEWGDGGVVVAADAKRMAERVRAASPASAALLEATAPFIQRAPPYLELWTDDQGCIRYGDEAMKSLDAVVAAWPAAPACLQAEVGKRVPFTAGTDGFCDDEAKGRAAATSWAERLDKLGPDGSRAAAQLRKQVAPGGPAAWSVTLH